MASQFACVGDRTDHGGTILSGAPNSGVEGKAIACVGDMVTCPKCGGNYPIISSKAPFVRFNGKSAAYHGDKTACGATIFAQQQLMHATQANGPSRDSPESPAKAYKGRFQLLDDKTAAPVRSRSYTVTSSDGQTISGATDSEGMTDWIESADPGSLQLKHTGDA